MSDFYYLTSNDQSCTLYICTFYICYKFVSQCLTLNWSKSIWSNGMISKYDCTLLRCTPIMMRLLILLNSPGCSRRRLANFDKIMSMEHARWRSLRPAGPLAGLRLVRLLVALRLCLAQKTTFIDKKQSFRPDPYHLNVITFVTAIF